MKETLAGLSVGESATVVENHTAGSMRRRLLDIGLVEGTGVTCAFQSPAGDPVAYRVRGAIIALRKEVGRKISVLRCDEKTLSCGVMKYGVKTTKKNRKH